MDDFAYFNPLWDDGIQMKAKSAADAALKIIRREMHSYDGMSNKTRYRVEPPKKISDRVNSRDVGLQHDGLCAHNILLIKPCDKCRRSEADALRDYGQSFIVCVAGLLLKANKRRS